MYWRATIAACMASNRICRTSDTSVGSTLGRRLQQDGGGVFVPGEEHRDRCAQALHRDVHAGVVESRGCQIQQCLGQSAVTGGQVRLRGSQVPQRTVSGVGRQLSGARQERGLHGVATPALGAHRGGLQVSGDRLLGSRHGGRPVPGSLVVLAVTVGHRGQRVVHTLALLGCRAVVHRRADEGMTECDARLQGHDPLLHSVIGRRRGDAQQRTSSPHRRWLVVGAGRGDEQNGACLR